MNYRLNTLVFSLLLLGGCLGPVMHDPKPCARGYQHVDCGEARPINVGW